MVRAADYYKEGRSAYEYHRDKGTFDRDPVLAGDLEAGVPFVWARDVSRANAEAYGDHQHPVTGRSTVQGHGAELKGLMPGRGTRGPNDGRAGTGMGGPGGTLWPRMPNALTDRPDGMIPQVGPRIPRVGLAAQGEEGDIPGVSGRLRGLLSRTSPYIQRARTRALQDANRRGLMSSSIAQGAGEAAAIDAALPIAQADAGIAASERAMAHEARQAELQRQFAGRQAELDRETQRLMQDRGLSFEAAQAEASRAQNQQRALQSGLQHAQDQYQTSLDRLTANLDLPVEERHRMEEHYSYVYDEALRGLQALYGVDISWTPRQRPTEAGV